MSVADKLATLRRHWRRDDLSAPDKAALLCATALASLGVDGLLSIGRHHLYEIDRPPPVPRGLRDLVVRAASAADAPALAAVSGNPPALVRARFRRGDLAFAGESQGRLLAHAFFHRGPAPFCEDEARIAPVALAPGTVWSYDAAAVADARATGVFVKVFTTALAEVFAQDHARVQSRVATANTRSILLHERLGFRRLGTLLAIATPWSRLLRWEGDAPRTLVTGWRPRAVRFPLEAA